MRSVLAVCAHPDDESFGLGAVLSAFSAVGTRTAVLCFTRGETSTLGGPREDLGTIREHELERASSLLGVGYLELLDYRDGGLTELKADVLALHVFKVAIRVRADLLLTFDAGGVTGHPDHHRATEAALAASVPARLPVLAWALEQQVAAQLNSEFGTEFVGRPPTDLDVSLRVERASQLGAIRCHASQSSDNPVLWRRLELQGDLETMRWLSGWSPTRQG